jgi:hypothetical protein
MYEGVKTLLLQNQDKTTEVPAFEESMTSFTTLLGELDQLAQDFGKATAGKAENKREAEDALVAALMPICSALFTYARKQNNIELKAIADMTEYEFRRLRDTDFKTKAGIILDEAEKYAADLVPYAVNAEKVAAARTMWTTFNEAMGKRESSTSERKGVRKSMEQVFSEIDELLADEIDRHMEHLKQNYSQFCEQYFSARMVKDIGVRHRIDVPKPTPAPVPAV